MLWWVHVRYAGKHIFVLGVDFLMYLDNCTWLSVFLLKRFTIFSRKTIFNLCNVGGLAEWLHYSLFVIHSINVSSVNPALVRRQRFLNINFLKICLTTLMIFVKYFKFTWKDQNATFWRILIYNSVSASI